MELAPGSQLTPGLQELVDLAPPPEVLAKTVLQLIDGEIEGREHEQEHWGEVTDCGTTCCVAGHVALEIGAHPTTDQALSGSGSGLFLNVVAAAADRYNNNDDSAYVPDVARAALRLSQDDADWLFDGLRTKGQIAVAMTNLGEDRPLQHGIDR